MKDPIFLLEKAIDAQRYRMKGYEKPSETISFETLRAIDFAYCRELFPELKAIKHASLLAESIRRAGVNEALFRVMPKVMQSASPRLSRSNPGVSRQVDEFLLDAGTLDIARRQLELVRADILKASIAPHTVMGLPMVILSVNDSTAYREQVGEQGLNWLSQQTMTLDSSWEKSLEDRHREILPLIYDALRRGNINSAFTAHAIDKHFEDWAALYLRRIAFSDLLGDDDKIGGWRYSQYLTVLTALSTISAQRLCYAGIMNADDPRIGIRNLITAGSDYTELVEILAHALDATTDETGRLLGHFSLTPANMEKHLTKGTPAFAPVVHINESFCILPSYGLEMNPFVFLFNELRARYEDDWFELVNNREQRWVSELL